MMEDRRVKSGIKETTFHLSSELVEAIKMRAVKEGKRFSKVAEEGLRQYMGLPEERVAEDVKKSTKKRKGSVKS